KNQTERGIKRCYLADYRCSWLLICRRAPLFSNGRRILCYEGIVEMPGSLGKPIGNLQQQFAGRQHLEAFRVWKQEEGPSTRRVDLDERLGISTAEEKLSIMVERKETRILSEEDNRELFAPLLLWGSQS
ncbi:hypothetical protein GOP47_0017044, partial [Adiantum capillus-veneris]